MTVLEHAIQNVLTNFSKLVNESVGVNVSFNNGFLKINFTKGKKTFGQITLDNVDERLVLNFVEVYVSGYVACYVNQ